ncbi:MAG TPA: M28 family peptidase [Telluria sp.]
MSKIAPFVLATMLHGVAFAATSNNGMEAVTQHVSPNSLRDHVSFLASDALEGRATPSRGLDAAADYIAAQFRRAGLTPAGDDGYFQTANWKYAERNAADFVLTVEAGGKSITVPGAMVSYQYKAGHQFTSTPVVRLDLAAAAAAPKAVEGKVLVIAMPANGNAYGAEQQLARAGAKPAAIILLDRARKSGNAGGKGWLVDPEAAPAPKRTPAVAVHAPDAIALLESGAEARVSLSIPAGVERPVKLRNVIGVLPGTDPVLKDSYVILSAHYDHVGINNGEVFNGANDNASGTASVIEVASALATLKHRPRRSIVFLTVWGEELGMLGSSYYGKHPVFPIAKTVANLNLEQMGRTDEKAGPQIDRAALTGFDFSSVGAILARTGASMGIKVFKHEQFSDVFFDRSDNQALAKHGIPAHTMSVAYEYADYHGKDDTWDKLDYDNMARITRLVAVGTHTLADDTAAPTWNEANTRTAPYVNAARQLSIKAK